MKKDKILKNYMSDDLIAEMVNSGTLLGVDIATEEVEEPVAEVDVDEIPADS